MLLALAKEAHKIERNENIKNTDMWKPERRQPREKAAVVLLLKGAGSSKGGKWKREKAQMWFWP